MSLNNYLIEFAEENNLKKGLDFFDDFYNSEKKENSGNLVKYFLELFPLLSKSFLKELEVASNFYFYSVLAIDKIIDEENSFDKEALLLAIALRENSLHRMYRIIEPESEYWLHFQKYYNQYLKALSIELKNRNGKISDINKESLEFLYSGNSALAKALPVAMAFKAGKKDILSDLEKSIDYYYIGLNLYDDVNDWKQDWQNNNYSYLITKTIINNDINISEISTKHLGHYIFLKHEASKCLEHSITYFKKAKEVLSKIECIQWKRAIQNNLDNCINLKEDIDMLVSKQLEITGVKKNEKISNKIPDLLIDSSLNLDDVPLANGLNYIFNQWKNGFPDATLHSFFPNIEGFEFNKRYYKADVFQRAVICDLIIDINREINNNLSPFIDYEINYLLNQLRSNGGWNYYENLEYQPNDADTTAQVMQVLIKTKQRTLISEKTIKAIDNLLEPQVEEKGRISTWLLPPSETQSSKEKRQGQFLKYYTNHDYDKSIDLEVIANLLFALLLFDEKKYSKSINLGIEFLESNQNPNGGWTSTWYWGDYYGTYICLRLLTKAKAKSKSIDKAKEFLLKDVNFNKTWGYKKSIDDPLNTAFALISLHYLSKLNYQLPIQRIKDACIYLKDAIINTEELKKSDYINLRRTKYTKFRSNSITIAYALKALILWKDLD